MTYDSVYHDTERNPNDERKENHGSCNVNFQELAKFTGTAKGGPKRLYKSVKVLSMFRTRFLEKQIVSLRGLPPSIYICHYGDVRACGDETLVLKIFKISILCYGSVSS